MVDRVGFQISGLNAVVRELRGLGADVDDLKDAFAKIADEGASRAASYVRSRTGRLAADIRGNRAKSKAVVTAGRSSVPYAGPVNYGWPARGIAAQQFLQKADQAMQPVAVRRLEEEINTRIRTRGLT